MRDWLSIATGALLTVSLVGAGGGADSQTACHKASGDEAIAACSLWIKIHPKDAVAINNRGAAYATKGDHERAIIDYNEAIRLNPKFAVAFKNRGSAYDKKGDYDRAIVEYNEAIRLDPHCQPPRYRILSTRQLRPRHCRL